MILQFFKKDFRFQKTYLRVKVMKMLKIFSIYLMKVCQSLKQIALLLPFFRGTYVLSIEFKIQPARISVFLYLNKNQLTLCCKSCWKDQPFLFCLFDESPRLFISTLTMRPWKFKTLRGSLKNNQKKARFYSYHSCMELFLSIFHVSIINNNLTI